LLTTGDVNGAFLVLTWGANPDSRDNNGDTPLLWLLRNKPLGTGGTAQELIKMLLRFGASPTLDNGTDGNSPLHVLAITKKPDMRACFLIYAAAGAVGKTITNKAGLTAYSVRCCLYMLLLPFGDVISCVCSEYLGVLRKGRG
jgi:ankyrin repeat protein